MLVYEHFLNIASKEIKRNGIRRILTPKSLDEIAHAVPLVFTPNLGTKQIVALDYDQSVPLDLPFKTVFFEMLGGYSIVNADGHLLCGIYVQEVTPRHYEFLSLYKMPNGAQEVHSIEDRAVADHYINVVATLLKRLYSEAVGESHPRTSIKIKSQGHKLRARIRKIVYITPKKEIEKTKATTSREIHWEHRWQVRGHWRSIPGRIGKDRDGNIQSDFTWVNDYTKGPEDAILISKPRVVRS